MTDSQLAAFQAASQSKPETVSLLIADNAPRTAVFRSSSP